MLCFLQSFHSFKLFIASGGFLAALCCVISTEAFKEHHGLLTVFHCLPCGPTEVCPVCWLRRYGPPDSQPWGAGPGTVATLSTSLEEGCSWRSSHISGRRLLGPVGCQLSMGEEAIRTEIRFNRLQVLAHNNVNFHGKLKLCGTKTHH